MLPPVITQVLLGIVRVLLLPLTDWLIRKNILTSDDTAKFLAELVTYSGTITWAALAWWRNHQKQMTALATAPGTTPAQLDQLVSAGFRASAMTPQNQAPVINDPATGAPATGTGPGSTGVTKAIGAIALLAALGAGASCAHTAALVATTPTDAQKIQLHDDAGRIADGIRVTLVSLDQFGTLATLTPIAPATKDAINCDIIKATGTSKPPSGTVVRICGAVPNGPGPLYRGLEELKTITNDAGLRTTIGAIRDAIDPLLRDLAASANPGLVGLGAIIKAGLGFLYDYLARPPAIAAGAGALHVLKGSR